MYVLALLVGAALIICLVLFALKQNISLFYTPQQLIAEKVPAALKVRVGGMVRANSVQQLEDLKIKFTITDFNQDLDVYYDGVLPDLFREGQGVVALGVLNDSNVFVAQQILAKHDENYMPPELVNLTARESS